MTAPEWAGLTQRDGTPAGYFEAFAWPEDHPAGLAGFVCSVCGRAVDEAGPGPCPDHAPYLVPGLYLVDCEATPRHYVWVLAGDHCGYGVPCLVCRLDEYAAQARAAAQCRHRPWRRWRLTHWLAGWAYHLGITSGGGAWKNGDGCAGCLSSLPRLRGPRPYILGVDRDTWSCWRRGHRPAPVGLGVCGRCAPWPCCGATTADHRPGCPEGDDVDQAAAGGTGPR